MTGKIIELFAGQVKNGTKKALFARVELAHGDVRNVQFFPGAGEESRPCVGDIATMEKSGGFYYITGLWDGKEPALADGERKLYSRDKDGKEKAVVYLDGNGNINLNGDSKSLVTYAELNQALQNMWSALKNHTHSNGNNGSPTGPPAGLSSLDISKSEAKTVKTGG